MKPLFIPLKKEYFVAFAKGEKRVEFRRYGKGWNERTCVPGRQVILSCGYSGARLYGHVRRFMVSTAVALSATFRACYPDALSTDLAACIEIEVL